MKRIPTMIGQGLSCLVASMLVGVSAFAQDFPAKPISIVTWSSVGGGGDVLARQLQDPFSKAAGVPVNVVNKPGGSGAVAMEYLSKQAPDGYTVLVGTASRELIGWNRNLQTAIHIHLPCFERPKAEISFIFSIREMVRLECPFLYSS